MKIKNELKVMINKKQYTLVSYESEEYMQRIATFINAKHAKLTALEGYTHLSEDMKNVLMQINLADEYFKMKEERDEVNMQLEEKNKEIFELKHELVKRKEERGMKRK